MVLRSHRSNMLYLQRTRLLGTEVASAKKLGVIGHSGVMASQEAAMLA
jgi:hypothetical protein